MNYKHLETAEGVREEFLSLWNEGVGAGESSYVPDSREAVPLDDMHRYIAECVRLRQAFDRLANEDVRCEVDGFFQDVRNAIKGETK